MHPRSLEWKIDLHHGTHSHPLVESMCCTTNPEIFIPSIGETDTNVWIKFHFLLPIRRDFQVAMCLIYIQIFHSLGLKARKD